MELLSCFKFEIQPVQRSDNNYYFCFEKFSNYFNIFLNNDFINDENENEDDNKINSDDNEKLPPPIIYMIR